MAHFWAFLTKWGGGFVKRSWGPSTTYFSKKNMEKYSSMFVDSYLRIK